MTINGVELDETKSLEENLDFLTKELSYRLGFQYPYDQAVKALKENSDKGELDVFDRLNLWIFLLPMRISYWFGGKSRMQKIQKARDLLIEHYNKPATRIRRLRKESQNYKDYYAAELKVIRDEIKKLEQNEQSTVIKEATRQQIQKLIKAYREKEDQRAGKHDYFKLCEQKLTEVEEQMSILKSIKDAEATLSEIKAKDGEEAIMDMIGKETELYSYYGEVLEDIAKDMRTVEEDKEEQIERLELEVLMEKVRR